MSSINAPIDFLFQTVKTYSILSRKFDGYLGGISLNEFIILSYLEKSPESKMRRVDLAEKIGLTASGITRLLLPMEKIWLIQREKNEHDARVSFVLIAPGGKRKLFEAMDRIEVLLQESFPSYESWRLENTTKVLQEIWQFMK